MPFTLAIPQTMTESIKKKPTTLLSPAAQAVLKAAGDSEPGFYVTIAAALRAAADQVVPDGPQPSANSDFHLMNWTKSLDQYVQRQQTRAELLTIADELDNTNSTSEGDFDD